MRDEDRKKVGRMLYERVKRAWKSGASGKGLVVLGAVGTITVLTVVAEGGCRIFGVKGPLSMLAGKLVG
jgi:hypothetical protein